MKDRIKNRIALLLALVLLSLGYGAFAEETELEVPELLEPVGVKLDTAMVTRRDMYNLNYFDACVVPYIEELSFVCDGSVDVCNVIAGDYVHAGDVLITLNQDDLKESIEVNTDKLAHLEKELEFADREDALTLAIAAEELEGMKSQVGNGVTREQVQIKEIDNRILQMQLKQKHSHSASEIEKLRSQLETDKSQLGESDIIAPFDGRIVYMDVLTHDSYVKAYETVIYLADDTRLSIDSEYINASTIKAANKLYARIGGVDYDVTEAEFDWNEYLSVALSGGTVYTGFEFADSIPEGVQAGDYATIFLQTGLLEDALVIPYNAMYAADGVRYVYKIDGDTRTRVNITVGRQNGLYVQVLEGLEEGDYVYIKE